MSENQIPLVVSICLKHDDTTLQDLATFPNYPEVDSRNTTMQPLTEFTIFGIFPPEIRQHIFSLVDNAPRLIVLEIPPKNGNPMVRTTPHPGILSATRESREMGLKNYETLYMENGLILVNWDIDTILDLDNTVDPSQTSLEQLVKMNETSKKFADTIHMNCQNLATSARKYYVYSNVGSEWGFHHFKALRRLSFYVMANSAFASSPPSNNYRFVGIHDERCTTRMEITKTAATKSMSTVREVRTWWLCQRPDEEWRSSDVVHIGSCFYETDLALLDLVKKFP